MPPLPIHEVLPQIKSALSAHTSVVLQAPPGAGKTTIVPPELLNEPWLGGRSILILEPRRLAARAAAARMADLMNEKVGETVGFRIRFESKVTARTRIEVLTEGILTRRLQSDPGLEGVGLVIFDEFHERHLHGDLALALCIDARRQLCHDLKILIMSATLEGEAISAVLNKAPVITSEGRLHPVDIRYEKNDPEDRVPETVKRAVIRALEADRGDVLVFLPGAWEIRRTRELLEKTSAAAVDLLPLYGDLPWEAQQKAIAPSNGGKRKVVLATPIAETSLTIDGVGVVIDSGFVRVPRFDPGSGLSRLVTTRISRGSADQRAGRAGRLGPGVCYRLWSRTTHSGLISHPIPEIRSADLTSLVLELAQWGVPDAETLSWLDPPPESALSNARRLLIQLGAVNSEGGITPIGKSMARMPLHPRLSHMVIEAEALGAGFLAADLAALLSERDPLGSKRRVSCDIVDRLEALGGFRKRGAPGARSFGADPAACKRVDQAARQIGGGKKSHGKNLPEDLDLAGVLLALAYPDRIAQQREAGGTRYILSSGRGVRLPLDERHLRPEFLVAASLDAGSTEGTIYLAAGIRIEDLRRAMAGTLNVEEVIRWDDQEKRVVAQREETLGELILESGDIPEPDPARVRSAMIQGIRAMGLEALPWSKPLRAWQARVLSMRHWFPKEDWPDVSDAGLFETLKEWLGPYLDGVTRRGHLARINLENILRARLDWKQNQELEKEAPSHLTVPSGSRLPLEYRPGESPVLAVKLQEMFGLADTPRVARGTVPVTLHLLSPARRPIQVTQDLRGFWDRTYPEVKKELKGRYPKHPWPDDPWKAPPTKRTKKRKT